MGKNFADFTVLSKTMNVSPRMQVENPAAALAPRTYD